jgi:hypothetical protein
MKKFYLNEMEVLIIAATPKKECWICDKLTNNINQDDKGYFLKEKKFMDSGIDEHLQQVINRKIIFS